MREHCEAIEYDLLVRGIDLRDLFTGDMSWRRFGVILRRLPAESEYKTDLRDSRVVDLSDLPMPEPGVHGVWSRTDMTLAGIFDRLGDLIYAQGGYEKPPRPLPRPGVDNVTPISATALQYLEYVREHHGEHPPDDWKPALA